MKPAAILIPIFASFLATAAPTRAIENGDPFTSGDSEGPRPHANRNGALDAVAAPAAPTVCIPDDFWQAPSCGPVAGTSWSPFPPSAVTPEELAAQQRANAAWLRGSYMSAVTDGRVSGNMPVGYATQFWDGATGAVTGPAGSARPVGASID